MISGLVIGYIFLVLASRTFFNTTPKADPFGSACLGRYPS
jgi:hypothetical protein